MVNKNHQKLLVILKKNAGDCENREWVKRYLGTTKEYLGIKTGIRQKLVKDYVKSEVSNVEEYGDLMLSLALGDSFDEVASVGTMLVEFPKWRKQLEPEILDKLLERVEGWAETDSICQSSYSPVELLGNWTVWERLLGGFNHDKNIYKRRASLVLLTKPSRGSNDTRLAKMAFANIEKLKNEKEILITKAISWLLRSLIKHHPKEVAEYLTKNEGVLPKVVIREVRNKLTTGKKSGKK